MCIMCLILSMWKVLLDEMQDGQTPLLIATRKGSKLIVATLLEADANPNFMLQVCFMYMYP